MGACVEEVETALKNSAFMKQLKRSRGQRAAFEKGLLRGMTFAVVAVGWVKGSLGTAC